MPSLSSPASERDLFRRFGFGSRTEIPFATVHEAFMHHAARTPDAVAICDLVKGSTREVTYKELLGYAQFIGARLQADGVASGSRVVLLVKRSVEMVAGILGILMCGAQYVPLDGAVVPDQTLHRAVTESKSTTALCLRPFEKRLQSLETISSIILLEDLLEVVDSTGFAASPLSVCAGHAHSGCYVIYTSGTTGTSKGVDVTHRNVTNILCQAPGNLGISCGSRVGQVLSISFDMGAWEILGSLCNGATLILRGSDWRAALKMVDILICTPSILNEYEPQDFPNIRCIATAGEPCSQSLADKWVARGAKFFNCCGPTEVTIINTMHDHKPGQALTIGKPTPNNNVYILDDNVNPVAVGEVGIMWAGGAGISRGYVGQPDKTAERYRYDQFVNDGQSLMYNTGDLARWLPDGSLETLGRNDDQVKIKGFRVELDGVSASLASCPGVTQGVALLIEGELTGFVTPETCDIEAMKGQMRAALPYYAIPSQWCMLAFFPLTSNGKIDKFALVQRCAQQRGSISTSTTAVSTSEKKETGFKRHEITGASFESSVSSIPSLKKPVPLAEKRQGKIPRGLRYRIFIVYRRLFSLVWLANIVALICILAIPSIGRQSLSTAAFANLTVAVLARQDVVINILFTICCSVPKSWPLGIRQRCAKIYHLGGAHSGAAVAAVSWYAGAIGYNLNSFVHGSPMSGKPSVAAITLSFMALALLVAMIVFAYPSLRKKNHNRFERVHRFFGWTALAIIWAQTVLAIRDQQTPTQTLDNAVARSPNFWMLVVITLSIASSWFFLKKVPVDAEVLSNHAVRLHFDYTVPVNGTSTRLSERPLIEWHSFATVPAPEATDGRLKGYSLVVSRAGDWTGRQISKPPTHIWTRGVPTCGVMRIATLFNRVVLVGTGSGIGPLLGHIQVPTCPFRLVWSTPKPAENFGKEILDAVYNADPDAVVHDTKTQGRPDLVLLTWNAVQEFGAEAVIVISNEKLTRKVVYGMETRGVPAYGAIWDS